MESGRIFSSAVMRHSPSRKVASVGRAFRRAQQPRGVYNLMTFPEKFACVHFRADKRKGNRNLEARRLLQLHGRSLWDNAPSAQAPSLAPSGRAEQERTERVRDLSIIGVERSNSPKRRASFLLNNKS